MQTGHVKIKICGLQDKDTALKVCELGAHAIGFVFADSKRRIPVADVKSIVEHLPPFISSVGVFTNPSIEEIVDTCQKSRITHVQLHSHEKTEDITFCRELKGKLPYIKIIKAKSIDDEYSLDQALTYLEEKAADALLIDTKVGNQLGGTGQTFDWKLLRTPLNQIKVRGIQAPIILAGGLNPDNIQQALRELSPWGVDVSSGVEARGKKDPKRIKDFIEKIREIDLL